MLNLQSNPILSGYADNAGTGLMFYNPEKQLYLNVTAGAVYVNSSSRNSLSSNVEPKLGLEIISSLSPVEYLFANHVDESFGKGNHQHFGFIAQEAEEICKEIVITGPEGDKSIDATAIVALTISAINDLTEKSRKRSEAIGKIRNFIGLNDCFIKIKNVTSQILECEYALPQNSIGKINLCELSGMVLYSSRANESEGLVVIPLSSITKGIYIVNLYNGEQLVSSVRVMLND